MAKDASGAVLEDRSWVYDGQLRVGSLSASVALLARYLYASSGHSPDLAVTFDPASGVVTGSYLLVHDQVGSVVRTVDLATGGAVESVAYDPWGVATVAPVGTAVHPFGFAGGHWDRRTGLVRFGAREYDAGLGRWLARDPIGFGGGWNHYGYAGGDPVGRVDPDGLNPLVMDKGDPSWIPGLSPDQRDSVIAGQGIAAGLGLGFLAAGSAWAGSVGSLLAWFLPERAGTACNRAAPLADRIGSSFGPRSLGAAHREIGQIVQSGGHAISKATADALNRATGSNLLPREWGRGLEALKGDLHLPPDFHGKLTANGFYLDKAGKILGNIMDYVQ